MVISLKNTHSIWKIIAAALMFVMIALIIAFIWMNSLTPLVQSQVISEKVQQKTYAAALSAPIMYIVSFFPDIRKAAHFAEYFALGCAMTLSNALLFSKSEGSRKYHWERFGKLIIAGIFIALIDESMQMFAAERTPMIADIWLDTSGYLIGIGCICFFSSLILSVKRGIKALQIQGIRSL